MAATKNESLRIENLCQHWAERGMKRTSLDLPMLRRGLSPTQWRKYRSRKPFVGLYGLEIREYENNFQPLVNLQELQARHDLPVVTSTDQTDAPIFILSEIEGISMDARAVLLMRPEICPVDHPVFDDMESIYKHGCLNKQELERLEAEKEAAETAEREALAREEMEENFCRLIEDFACYSHEHVRRWYEIQGISGEKLHEIALTGISDDIISNAKDACYALRDSMFSWRGKIALDGYGLTVETATEHHVMTAFLAAVYANLRAYALQIRAERLFAWRKNWLNLLDVKPLEQPAIVQPVMQQAAGSDFMTCVDIYATLNLQQSATIHQFSQPEITKEQFKHELTLGNAILKELQTYGWKSVDGLYGVVKMRYLGTKKSDYDDIYICFHSEAIPYFCKIMHNTRKIMTIKSPNEFFIEKPEPMATEIHNKIMMYMATHSPKKTDKSAKIHQMPRIEQAQEKEAAPIDMMEEIKKELCKLGWYDSGIKDCLRKPFPGDNCRKDDFMPYLRICLIKNGKDEIFLQDGYINPIIWNLAGFDSHDPAKIAAMIDRAAQKYDYDTYIQKKNLKSI